MWWRLSRAVCWRGVLVCVVLNTLVEIALSVLFSPSEMSYIGSVVQSSVLHSNGVLILVLKMKDP